MYFSIKTSPVLHTWEISTLSLPVSLPQYLPLSRRLSPSFPLSPQYLVVAWYLNSFPSHTLSHLNCLCWKLYIYFLLTLHCALCVYFWILCTLAHRLDMHVCTQLCVSVHAIGIREIGSYANMLYVVEAPHIHTHTHTYTFYPLSLCMFVYLPTCDSMYSVSYIILPKQICINDEVD